MPAHDRNAAYPIGWEVDFAAAMAPPPGERPMPQTTVLRAGSSFPPAAMPLPCDVVWERDVQIPLRDGVVILADVLRPAGAGRVPALLAWSPYGKDIPAPFVAPGVAPEQVSGLAKFEGPDPGFWVDQGYAVLNVDPRGVRHSGGDVHFWGRVDAADGHDAVEWAAAQPWCNGRVGLHGTSWLAMVQWHIAATQPPHLAAIAPWNGLTDPLRHDVCWGGIPNLHFMAGIASHLEGKGRVERPDLMLERTPLTNPYWEDKAAPLEQVRVPAYVATDFVTDLHRLGTVEGFRRLGSPDKWLRVHARQEWSDQYDPASQRDLLRFFDHYLKGVDNGWPTVPRVRLAVMGPDADRAAETVDAAQWPLPGTRHERWHLDASAMQLLRPSAAQAAATSLVFDLASGHVSFTLRVDASTRIAGYLKAVLWVEALDGDDLDLFVLVEQIDAEGRVMAPSPLSATQYFPVPPPGSQGRLRASMRELDARRSTDWLPLPALRRARALAVDEVVCLEIAVMPTSLRLQAGQQLRLTVQGREFTPTPLPPGTVPGPSPFPPPAPPLPTINRGRVRLFCGGERPSCLQLPVLPG